MNSTNPFLPPLQRMVQVFRETWTAQRFAEDVIPSLIRFGAGFLIATVAGIIFGLLLGLWPPARRATAPTIDFLRSIPAPALISVMIILFGFGNGMKITAIAFASFFPVLLNTIDGVRGVEPLQLEMAKAFKLRRSDEIRLIILPAASPQIFVGLASAWLSPSPSWLSPRCLPGPTVLASSSSLPRPRIAFPRCTPAYSSLDCSGTPSISFSYFSSAGSSPGIGAGERRPK